MNEEIKTIALFGASGQTGRAIIAEASIRNIKIRTSKNRNPSKEDLFKTVSNADAVMIVFGPRPPYTDVFCAEETKKIIQAMEKARIKRLICQTGAMIGDYSKNRSFIFQVFSERFRKSNPLGYNDRVQQEQAVRTSALEWTIIKPPRLTNSENDNRIYASKNIKVGLLSSVSRKSLARFIIEELLTPHYIHNVVFIKN